MTVMRIIDAATSLRFSAVCSSTSSYEVSSIHVSSRRLLRSTLSDVPWNRSRRSDSHSSTRGRITAKNWLRASIEDVGSSSDPSNQNGRLQYHPSEDISESLSDNEDAKLTAQETARTIVEVNRKATLMLSDLINDDIHENIVWPDMPYMTDEHGNVYFKVKKDEDILQTITSENNFVQAVIGFDTSEILNEMELLDSSQFDLGIEEIDDEDSDLQDDDEEEEDESEYDDYDEDLVAVLDDEDEKDDSDIGDWAKLDTMRSSHPMYFARQLALVASDDPMDWMEQPPVGLVIQGLIRPTFIEEHSNIQRHLSINQSNHADINCDERKDKSESEEDLGGVGRLDHLSGPSIDGSNLTEESEKDGVPRGGTSFYKLEMIKIQLISPHGHQSMVDVEDYRKSQPDAIAHSAEKIISRLKAGGEKITEALKSVCWRCKGIQVEEAVIIGIDSRGFDLRVCSGTQVQTLRFPFNSRATSEYGAERQLNDILHPRIHHSMSKKKQAHQKEQ